MNYLNCWYKMPNLYNNYQITGVTDTLSDVLNGEKRSMGEPVELLEDADIDIREGEGINSQVFGRFLLGRGVVSLKTLMLALER